MIQMNEMLAGSSAADDNNNNGTPCTYSLIYPAPDLHRSKKTNVSSGKGCCSKGLTRRVDVHERLVLKANKKGAKLNADAVNIVFPESHNLDDYIEMKPGAGSDAKTHKLPLGDIIGCNLLEIPQKTDDSAYVSIYCYPAVYPEKDFTADYKIIERHVYTLRISSSTGDQAATINKAEAKALMGKIRGAVHAPETPLHAEIIAHEGDKGTQKLKRNRRRLLILINPYSGPGRAEEIFETRVEPVLEEANIECEYVVTERRGHALELVATLDLYAYDGIVIVSGDGLVHEVLNGLMLHNDVARALKMPVGFIPGGSGNAAAAAVMYQCNQPSHGDSAREAAAMIARPRYMPMKLINVQTKERNIASFMSVSWGIIADIDIGSEKFRNSLGSARFVFYGYLKTMALRKYRCRLSYLPSDKQNPDGILGEVASTDERFRTTPPKSAYVNEGAIDDNGNQFDEVELDNKQQQQHHFNNGALNNNNNNNNNDSNNNSPPSSKHANAYSNPVTTDGIEIRSLLDKKTRSPEMANVWRSGYPADIADQIPDINDPVPDSWTTIEDDFIMLLAVSCSHIQELSPYIPWSKLNDDVIYLTLIPASVGSRYQVAKCLLSLDNGNHLKVPAFQVVPVRAFRIEQLGPEESQGHIVVDGELIPERMIQCVVTEHKATVCGR